MRPSSAMKRPFRVALLACIIYCATVVGALAQPKKAEGAARGQSTVLGRVVYEDTGRPLRRVAVSIFDPNNRGRQHRQAWTNGRGEFVFKNVEAGKYYVHVSALGILQPDVFDPGAKESELTVVSVDGTGKAEVRVRVRRGGAITGQISYADGAPATNVTLGVWHKKNGQFVPYHGNQGGGWNGSQTDERGSYRVTGLPPGEYAVGVAEQKMNVDETEDEDGGHSINRALLGFTFYAGATNLRAATPIHVSGSEEADDIDITLVERSTHAVSGIIVRRRDSRPIARARITLSPKDEASGEGSFSEGNSVRTDARGLWSLDEVPDGVYTLTVMPGGEIQRGPEPGGAAVRPAPKFAVKKQELTVGGGDLNGLVIEVSEGGRVSGVVAVDGGRSLPREIRIYLEAAEAGERMPLPSAHVRQDGTFTLEGLPAGAFYLGAYAREEGRQQYFVKSIGAGDLDLLREPLDITDGAEVKDVRLVISPDVTTLTGRVLASGDQTPVRGAMIMLIPSDPGRQRRHSARLHGQANAEGQFTITGAPGDYLAIVMRPSQRVYGLKDDELKALAAAAPPVTLRPGERQSMDLTVLDDK
ncbi:MAG: carboxypeptidase-like regulatory domain-containing protein [Acidobacteriota bacterium]|nr:carboxypeptidase-like regulatory domain-containing protein [Acidobacteriota bacterium]